MAKEVNFVWNYWVRTRGPGVDLGLKSFLADSDGNKVGAAVLSRLRAADCGLAAPARKPLRVRCVRAEMSTTVKAKTVVAL